MSQADSTSLETSPEDDWTGVVDPNERRKIQNRIAQRKFREKLRQQREDAERDAENARYAAGAYTTPEPEDIDTGDVSGLPWGGLSWRHIIATGKAKALRSTTDTSLYALASRTGGSSRVGLHLIDQYARGHPVWATWQARVGPYLQQRSLQSSETPLSLARQQSWTQTAA